MTCDHVTRTVRWLLIPTIILAALTVLAARNAYAQGGPEDRGPEEWDVTKRWCDLPPVMLGNRPYPGPPPIFNSLIAQQPPPVIPAWGPGNSPKIATFVWFTKRAYATPHAKKMRQEGWEVDRTSIFCENLFAHDEHNARLIWFVLGVAGQGRDVRMREDALHCIMVQARFPNITQGGSVKCGRRWRTIITSLADVDA
jgi:hypothetical protein